MGRDPTSQRGGDPSALLLGLPLARGCAPPIAWRQWIRIIPHRTTRARIALSFQGLQCAEGVCPSDPREAKAWTCRDTAVSFRMP